MWTTHYKKMNELITNISHSQILILLITFRLLNSVFVSTYFSADEYYQGTEIAHSLHFPNHSHIISWEWQPEHALRGYMHPMILSTGYYLMDYIQQINLLIGGIENTQILLGFLSWWLPQMVQSILTAISDFYLFLLCEKYFGNKKLS